MRQRSAIIFTTAQPQKKGLLGSKDRRAPLCIDTVKNLLSESEDFKQNWSVGNVTAFAAQKDKPTPDYALTEDAQQCLDDVLLPGQKCHRRSEEYSDFCTNILYPLRASMREYLDEEKLKHGVVIGLRYGSSMWRWFDVYIRVKSPAKMLCYEIDESNVTTWSDVTDPLSGEFRTPVCLKLAIPDLFGGRSVSLYSILQESSNDSPSLMLYLAKEQIQITDGAWHCLFSNEFVLHRSVDYLQVKSTSINAPNTPGKAQGSRKTAQETDVEQFRYDVDDEFGELGNSEDFAEEDSDAELARRLVQSIPSLKGARSKIQDQIDLGNYSVKIDEDRGLAITYARTTQRNRNKKVFAAAQAMLKKHQMRTLSNSFSAIFTSKGFAKYVEDAVRWHQWHSSWVYNTPVTVRLNKDMPTPQDIAILEGVDINRPEDEERGGFISGTEPSEGPGSDSSDEETSEDEVEL